MRIAECGMKNSYQVENPTPKDRMQQICAQLDEQFGLVFDGELGTEIYEIIIRHIRFRQKCHNQGFDNLVHLIEMHRDDCKRVKELNPEDDRRLAKGEQD